MKKNFIYILLIAIMAVIAFVPGVKNFLKDTFFPVASIENAVKLSDTDYDIELKGINTPNANLNQFKDKTLFLNFWGTWCPPCKAEWPSVEALYKAKKDKMSFVLIAMQDEEENVRKFIKENNYTAPVYIAQSPISEKVLPKAFPTTFIIAKNAQIVKKVDAKEDWMSQSNVSFIDAIVK